ncbi:MAG: thioredoxin-related protein [Arenicella sp.]|jgi:thioredoxin-related protein
MKALLIIGLSFLSIVGYSINSTDLQRLKAFSMLEDAEAIVWFDFESAIDQNEIEKKPIFIDIYTSWCGWCTRMDESTFKDPKVVSYMNEHFYAVKMDAESKEAIAFKEKLYEAKNYNGKTYNELAVNLMGGKMSFPSFVILSKRQVKIGKINGYKKPTELISALQRYEKK